MLVKNVLAENVRVGMSSALSGPLSEMGLSMQAGINAYFSKINSVGGIKGNHLELLALDDAYEPVQAAANMRELINKHEVVAVLGNVGTPTAVVTVPIAEQFKIALVGAFSGGDVLRPEPPSQYIINFRPGYRQEVATLINGLLDAGIQPEDIAFFTQQDSYGNAVFQAATLALQARGFIHVDFLTHAYYSRNTLNVEGAVATILKAEKLPKVILMGGSYAPSAKFIKLLHESISDVWFVNVSFVGSHVLERSLKGVNANVLVSQVVPEIDAELPVVDEYRKALAAYDESLQPNTVSLEGYIVAKVFCQALQRIDGSITRESVSNALHDLADVDIGLESQVVPIPSSSQISNKVWLSKLENGTFQSFEWRDFELSH
uniref:Leucine/isoleucine/valine-binding protein n=2 Tax=Methylophaga nitratireducenticrescens TaxID=754476 RepID=I1XIF7_METNJ